MGGIPDPSVVQQVSVGSSLCHDSPWFREFQFSFLYSPWFPNPYFVTRMEVGVFSMPLGISVFFHLSLFILHSFTHGMSVRWRDRHVNHLKLRSHASAMEQF